MLKHTRVSLLRPMFVFICLGQGTVLAAPLPGAMSASMSTLPATSPLCPVTSVRESRDVGGADGYIAYHRKYNKDYLQYCDGGREGYESSSLESKKESTFKRAHLAWVGTFVGTFVREETNFNLYERSRSSGEATSSLTYVGIDEADPENFYSSSAWETYSYQSRLGEDKSYSVVSDSRVLREWLSFRIDGVQTSQLFAHTVLRKQGTQPGELSRLECHTMGGPESWSRHLVISTWTGQSFHFYGRRFSNVVVTRIDLPQRNVIQLKLEMNQGAALETANVPFDPSLRSPSDDLMLATFEMYLSTSCESIDYGPGIIGPDV